MKKYVFNSIRCLLFIVFLSNCAYTYQTKKYSELSATLSEGNSRIVIIRKGSKLVRSNKIHIYLNPDKYIGRLGVNQRHLSWEVLPELYLLRLNNGTRNVYFEIDAKENKTYYLQITTHLKLFDYEMRLKPISEDVAQNLAKKQKKPIVNYTQ